MFPPFFSQKVPVFGGSVETKIVSAKFSDFELGTDR